MKLLFVLLGFVLLTLGSPFLRAADDVQITEFMALNTSGIEDEDGDNEDWIEIHNFGSNAVSLAGWYLTDTTNRLTNWMFPAVTLAPDGYLVVFASAKDRNVGELHTNFRLSGGGEYLGLIRPDGVTVASEFYPTYPIQAPDVSYGLRGSTVQETLLAPGAFARALVPTNAALEDPPSSQRSRPWTFDGLDDSGWKVGTTGVGYEIDTGYEALLGLDVREMYTTNQTVYIRIPFVVNDPASITALTLRMRYDDGFIAYINGHQAALDNAPDPTTITWTNGAPNNRADSSAVVPANFNMTSSKDFLHVGTNLLAIQGLNNGNASSDLLILPEILATVTGSTIATLRYFPIPTPGGPNNAGVAELGPIIEQEDHHPAVPTDSDALQISAYIHPSRGSVTNAVLHYRTNFGAEVTIPLRDDGNSGDAGIGDSIYGAIIPADATAPGQMVRWYITAQDSFGGSSRFPSFVEPLNGPEYSGTIVFDPNLTTPLPVLYWFVQNPAAAETGGGTRASLFYEGIFYDNLFFNIHGQSSQGFPKKSFNVDFHPGHNFKFDGPGWAALGIHSPSGDGRVGTATPRADDINLLTTYPDKAHMRNILAYETYRDADVPYHWVIPARIQQNGAFWGTVHIVENGDEDWLIRMGLNSTGALYKMYNVFASTGDTTSGAEKKTRKSESNADLLAFFNGAVAQTGDARKRYIYDNVDVPEVVDFLAAKILTGDVDCCHKNYYFYRDTGLSDEWQMWPWDVDLSFGRVWTSAQTYWQTNMIPDTPLNIGNNNGFVVAMFNTPEIYQMYLRRVRTLMDDLLKPAGTPPEALHYEPRIDELAPPLTADAALDASQWGSDSWGNGSTAACCPLPLPQAVAQMRDSYLSARRTYLYGLGTLPAGQSPATVINFVTVDANPSSGNQDQEYIQLQNPNAFAADISGWRLAGAIDFTFKGGTVIPAGTNFFVAANRKAFRARTVAPTGNQALLVVGDYAGRLSARGEALQLVNRQGVVVATLNTPVNPSAAQNNLRITELMYHPPILPVGAGEPADQEEYEYIELKNIGGSTLSLSNVHFSQGIEFTFPSNFTLAPLGGGPASFALVVKNTNAFTLRYGAAVAARIAGVYIGNLENAGERIRLDDANNEKILDFTYNNGVRPSSGAATPDNAWYPITDGRGFSLAIVDASAGFDTWSLKISWRPSGHEYGTPTADDPALPTVAPILINELLSHTDLPQKDAIELFNPTTLPVDVTGWYITDDPSIPKKFKIPTRPSIAAGSYIYFTEDDFNPTPGTPPSFSFSSTGDEAYLYSANGAGELTGYHHGYNFDASETGVSFGRYLDSQTNEQFVAMATLTLGGSNSAPKVGPIVISEINYHPVVKLEGIDYVEDFAEEYIELRNITGTPVPLYDTNNPGNTWHIRGGVEFDFPGNVSIPANTQLLVVSFHPINDPVAANAFRARHGLPTNALLAGPFTGQLGNDGDDLRLRRPDTPEGGIVPYILIDRVQYDDQPPWPTGPDGYGPSLQRRSLAGFGNDPSNWTAAAISPGAAYPGGNAPALTIQPTNLTVVAGSNVTFSVTANGDAPLRYQWLFNGNALPGKTNNTLLLPNVQLTQQGNYSVHVFNAASSVASTNAFLTVLPAVRITQQPQAIAAHLGGSANFSVQGASSRPPVTYQWRKAGAPLLGKTNNTLTISNIAQSDDAIYDVVLSDAISSTPSAGVRLTVLLYPEITTQPPSNYTATVITPPVNVTLSVVATSATPLRYQWYFNGGALMTRSNIAAVTNSSLTINNVQLSDTGDYFVTVCDNFSCATSIVTHLTVNTRAIVTLNPISQTVPQNGTISFSAAWNGPGPFLHRWRRTSPGAGINLGFIGPTNGLSRLMLTNGYITASPSNTVLVFTNVFGTNGAVYTYDIVISNAVGSIQSSNATLTIIPDTDHDGLPDSWETGRANFATNNPADALRDDDTDGINNAGEYLAGTDYLTYSNSLRCAIAPTGNLQISFEAVSNRTYMVQYNETLGSTNWVNLLIEPAKTNTRPATIVDPTPRPRRFYRIATPAQP